MHMQRTTSGAAGNGLYTTTMYMHGAAGISMGISINQVPATHNERRRKQRPEKHDQVPCELNAGAVNRTTTEPRPTYTKIGTVSADPPLVVYRLL
jgi:hypothetical protein